MKKVVKYIILSVLALAFYDSTRAKEGYAEDIFHCDIQNACLSSPDVDLCIPRPVSSVNSVHMQNNNGRSENSHRNNEECFKSGKTVNSGIRYIAQRKSLLFHSSHIEPTYTQVLLCRFLI